MNSRCTLSWVSCVSWFRTRLCLLAYFIIILVFKGSTGVEPTVGDNATSLFRSLVYLPLIERLGRGKLTLFEHGFCCMVRCSIL